jgi:hypothetical protein
MNRGVWVVAAIVLVLGSTAVAAEQGGRSAGTKVAPTAESGTEKAPKKRLKRGAKPQEDESGVSAAARSRARRVRSVYLYAVESCERQGDRCDPTLRDDAEARFLEACGACAPSDRCQTERDAIRKGTSRSNSKDPCAP